MSIFEKLRRFVASKNKRRRHQGRHTIAVVRSNFVSAQQPNITSKNFNISTKLQEMVNGNADARLLEFGNVVTLLLLRDRDTSSFFVLNSGAESEEVPLSEWLTANVGAPLDWRVDSWHTDVGRPTLVKDLISLTETFIANQVTGNDLVIRQGDYCDEAIHILNEINSIDKNSPSIFEKNLGLNAIKNGNLSIEKNDKSELVLDRFLPLKDFHYVLFSSVPTEGICVLLTGHNKLARFIYHVPTNHLYGNENPLTAGIHASDLAKISAWWLFIRPLLYSSKSLGVRTGVVLRESHIAHYVWNELSVIDDLLELKRNVEVFATSDCTEPVALIESVFPELNGHVTRRVEDFSQIILAATVGNVAFLPFASHRVSRGLSERIATAAQKEELQYTQWLARERQHSTIILIGLRVENRTWIRQSEGYQALIRKLSTITDRSFLIVFDGHNYLPGSSVDFVASLCENTRTLDDLPPTIKEERKIISQVIEYLNANNAHNIRIISDVPCTMGRSIVSSLYADYVITYFGAGMAKYKWIANAPTLVLSSKKTLTDKFDLRIFDTDEFREDVNPAEYYPLAEITDVGIDTNLINIPFVSPYRADFDLEPNLFADFVVARIMQTTKVR